MHKYNMQKSEKKNKKRKIMQTKLDVQNSDSDWLLYCIYVFTVFTHARKNFTSLEQ